MHDGQWKPPQWWHRLRKFFVQEQFRGYRTRADQLVVYFFALVNWLGQKLSPQMLKSLIYEHLLHYLLQPLPSYEAAHPLLGSPEEELIFLDYKKRRFLEAAQPGDVILVRGDQRISQIIQTLTQSPYSHAAFYRGQGELIEADPAGILLVPIDKYIHLDIRICRPAMITPQSLEVVKEHMEEMLRLQPKYDVMNIEKLWFKYMYSRFRPDVRMYIGGSSKFETYYICSGLIAHGFQKANYPIVPMLGFRKKRHKQLKALETVEDYFAWANLSKKNYSQIVPADFDNSSFFHSIKFLFLDVSKRTRRRKFPLE